MTNFYKLINSVKFRKEIVHVLFSLVYSNMAKCCCKKG